MVQPRKWWKKYKFVIEIDGIARAAFNKCSELRANAETSSYREGGRANPHKSPGLVEFPPITLERGKTDDYDLYEWFLTTFKAASGTGTVTPDLYRTFDIVQQDRDGNEVERWTVYDAWCKEYGSGDWDNDSSDVAIEQVVIELDHFERTKA